MNIKNILILYAHPQHKKSRINRAMINAISDLENVVINDLYENYYDFFIDVKREQGLLEKAELVIFHHPFYWYSAPPLLKEWEDRVFESGFAYGDGGNALQGKDLISVISTGGRETSYGRDGHNKFTIRELLQPFEATANLCGMNYLEPIIIQGTFDRTDEEIEEHVNFYKSFLQHYQPGNRK